MALWRQPSRGSRGEGRIHAASGATPRWPGACGGAGHGLGLRARTGRVTRGARRGNRPAAREISRGGGAVRSRRNAARGGGTSAPLSRGDDRKPPLPRSRAASDAVDPARADAGGAGLHSCGAILGGGDPVRSGADHAQSRNPTGGRQDDTRRIGVGFGRIPGERSAKGHAHVSPQDRRRIPDRRDRRGNRRRRPGRPGAERSRKRRRRRSGSCSFQQGEAGREDRPQAG